MSNKPLLNVKEEIHNIIKKRLISPEVLRISHKRHEYEVYIEAVGVLRGKWGSIHSKIEQRLSIVV